VGSVRGRGEIETLDWQTSLAELGTAFSPGRMPGKRRLEESESDGACAADRPLMGKDILQEAC